MSRLAVHEAEVLATKIKLFEKAYSLSLPPNRPYIVRLDGVSFKKFTSPMTKPFDPHFTRAIILATRDLLERSAALTAYCQSDEITLLFGPEQAQANMMYAGRTEKISSILASIASVRFNHHISKTSEAEIKGGSAFFDARTFSVPDNISAMESLYWRHKFDLRRNSVNSVGFHTIGHKAMENKPLSAILETLRSDHNIDPFTTYPPEAMLGTFMKKIQYNAQGYNPVTGKHVDCVRCKVEARSFDWEGTPEERTEMAMSKFWEPHHPQSLVQIALD